MADYFIAPKKTKQKISVNQLKERIKTFWPDAKFILNEQDNVRYLEWSFQAKNHYLEGYLFANLEVIVLDGDVIDCAEFAVKVFPLLPEGEYHFFDEGYSQDVLVTDKTSVADLANPFLLDEYKI